MSATGGVIFCEITITSVSMHPFKPVTVSVYVPGVVMVVVLVVETVVELLDQVYVLPPLPLSVMDGVLQVSTCVFGLVKITAVGFEISCVIAMLVVAVQPFWSSIASE